MHKWMGQGQPLAACERGAKGLVRRIKSWIRRRVLYMNGAPPPTRLTTPFSFLRSPSLPPSSLRHGDFPTLMAQ